MCGREEEEEEEEESTQHSWEFALCNGIPYLRLAFIRPQPTSPAAFVDFIINSQLFNL